MAKKESRISINKLENTLTDNITRIPLSDDQDVEIIIRRMLPLKDMMQFVANVVSSCVDVKTSTYTPDIKEFAFKSEVLTTYANFTLPSNAEKQYDLVYRTNVYDKVIEHVDGTQLFEIRCAIENRIEYELKLIEASVELRTNEMMERINDVLAKFESVFSNVDGDEVHSVMKKITEMDGMTEESIAKAVLDVQNKEKDTQNDVDEKVVVFHKPKEK